MLKISELQKKNIVNMENGKFLGYLTDLDINLETGEIEAIVISAAGKMVSFFQKDAEMVIPWSNIFKIGDDVILVHIPKKF